MTLTETWNNLCTPAQLYFIMSVIAFLYTAWGFPKALSLNTFMFQSLIVLVWTYLLGLICSKGWTNVSWFLVIAPWILSLYLFFTVMKNIHLQSIYTPKVSTTYIPPSSDSKSTVSTSTDSKSTDSKSTDSTSTDSISTDSTSTDSKEVKKEEPKKNGSKKAESKKEHFYL